MRWLIGTMLAGLLLPAIAVGDEWKDESGKSWKDWEDKSWNGETPRWARGRGYWDGHWGGYYPGAVPFYENGDGYWTEPDDSYYSLPWSIGVQGVVRTGPFAPAGAPFVAPGLEIAELNYRALRRMAHTSLADFDRWLTEIPAGELWRRHFDTRAALELLAPDQDAAPTPREREAFARVLVIFDEAVENADLSTLTRMDGFRRSRVALRELATPVDERLVRQLSLSARNLHRSLAGLSTGTKWQRYLTLPDDIMAAADRPPAIAKERPGINRDALAGVLERFELVSRNPEYRGIAALPAFQVTHERLTALLHLPSEAEEEAPPPIPKGALPPPPEPNGGR